MTSDHSLLVSRPIGSAFEDFVSMFTFTCVFLLIAGVKLLRQAIAKTLLKDDFVPIVATVVSTARSDCSRTTKRYICQSLRDLRASLFLLMLAPTSRMGREAQCLAISSNLSAKAAFAAFELNF